MKSEIKEEFVGTGLRVIHTGLGTTEDHDPAGEEDYEYTEDDLIIHALYDYTYPKDSEVIAYNLYEQIEDGISVGWVRRDLDGNLLED